jgi:DNA polymerase-3 subunit epsilon
VLSYGALTRGTQSGRLRHRPPGGTDPRDLEFAVLDTETTGLDPRHDRICEIALVRLRGDGTVLDTYDTLVDPGMPIDNADFHGIVDADVRGAPLFPMIAPDLLDRMSGAILVAHNLAFDAGMLEVELRRAGLEPPDLVGLCTLTAGRAQLDLRSYRLPEIVRALTGAPPAHTHWALGDARACALVLGGLIGAAPRPMRYHGPPAPVLAVPQAAEPLASRPRAVGASPEPPGCPPYGTAVPAWRAAWRRHELDQDLCRGRFDRARRRRARLITFWRRLVHARPPSGQWG